MRNVKLYRKLYVCILERRATTSVGSSVKASKLVFAPWWEWPWISISLFGFTLLYLALKYVTDWNGWIFIPFEYLGTAAFFIGIALLINHLYAARKVCALISILALIIWFPNVANYFALNTKGETLVESDGFSVFSYNIEFLPHLGKSVESRRATADYIFQLDMDIYCVQEFEFPAYSSARPTPEALEKYFSERGLFAFIPHPTQVSTAVFSKYPIIDGGEIPISKATGLANSIIYVDLETPSGILRLYNVHIGSQNLIWQAWNLLKSGAKSDLISSAIAYIKTKETQLRVLIERIDESELPVMVCGDINDLPGSYVYQKIKSRLSNVFESHGFGLGATKNSGPKSFARVDHIFASGSLNATSYTTRTDITQSDHFPVEARFRMVSQYAPH